MKKIFSLLIGAVMLVLPLSAAASSLSVGDTQLTLGADSEPITEGGAVLLPLRAVYESLGATIAWDEETRTVFVIMGEDVLVLQIDNETAIANNEQVLITPAPRIFNDRTFVSAEALAGLIGLPISVEDGDIRILAKN